MRKEAHLEVHLGVPVLVEDDDGVRALQVEAQPARARGQQEREVGRRARVEGVEGGGALGGLGGAVKAQVGEARGLQRRLDEVQAARELAEQQHPAPQMEQFIICWSCSLDIG